MQLRTKYDILYSAINNIRNDISTHKTLDSSQCGYIVEYIDCILNTIKAEDINL